MPTILTYAEAASLVLKRAQERAQEQTQAQTQEQTHHLAAATPRQTERVPLHEALHRVLAQPIRADRDLPPFHRSTRDGYAVQSAALATGDWLPIAGILRAGEPPPTAPLVSGTALEIMTGAPVPAGADAVVMLEHVEIADTKIRLSEGRKIRPGSHIVPTGSEARRGDPLVSTGTRLAATHIGALAAVGAAQVEVFTKPRVAILATGDELVEIAATPQPHQIRNSNSASLAAQVTLAGGKPERLGIARDHLDDLRAILDSAQKSCDLLLLSGGVSAGKYDLVEQALAQRGATFHFTGVRIQPGKPTVFGELPRKDAAPLPFFGLPGNPVSTMVTFMLFAAPMLRALAGESNLTPRFAQASLTEPESPADITRFLPAYLDANWDHATVRRIPWQGSGDLAATAQSNCFVVLPPDTAIEANSIVQVLLP
ncbi:MAG TPA: gephyrin-like molybdotransferase Glp [Acidobacteriaceae bacterium]